MIRVVWSVMMFQQRQIGNHCLWRYLEQPHGVDFLQSRTISASRTLKSFFRFVGHVLP